MKYTDLCARLDDDLPSIRPNQQWSFRKDLDMPRIEAERKEAAAAIQHLLKANNELEAQNERQAQGYREDLGVIADVTVERLRRAEAAEARVAELTRERDAVWPTAEDVAEASEDGKGFWKSCCGCHETNEGVPTGPLHPVLKCCVGGGCAECGGIGAIWDTTDYADMGDWLVKQMDAPAPDAVEALVKAAAQDAREVFEGCGSKAREAIDYMEQVALAAIRKGATP